MSELSCGTRFIGRNETLDLSLYRMRNDLGSFGTIGASANEIRITRQGVVSPESRGPRTAAPSSPRSSPSHTSR